MCEGPAELAPILVLTCRPLSPSLCPDSSEDMPARERSKQGQLAVSGHLARGHFEPAPMGGRVFRSLERVGPSVPADGTGVAMNSGPIVPSAEP